MAASACISAGSAVDLHLLDLEGNTLAYRKGTLGTFAPASSRTLCMVFGYLESAYYQLGDRNPGVSRASEARALVLGEPPGVSGVLLATPAADLIDSQRLLMMTGE